MQEQPSTEAGDAQLNARASGVRVKTVEIDLMDIVRDIWNAKYTLAMSLVFAIVLAVLIVIFFAKQYTSTTVLGPAESSTQQGIGASLGQFAGAASLLGVNLGSSGDTDFVKFTTLLTSERLARALLQDKSLRTIFFPRIWVPKTQTWKKPTGVVFQIVSFLKDILGLPRWQPPVPYSLQQALALYLSITTDKVTGYVTVSFDADSPEDAANTLGKIIKAADELIRQDVKNIAAGRIVYLNNVLQKTTLQDQRDAIITILSAQEKTMMMTSADKTYAIDVIDPPTNSPKATSPRPGSLLVICGFLAIVLASLWAAARGHFVVRSTRALSGSVTRDPSLDVAVRKWLEARWRRLRSRDSRLGSIFRRVTDAVSRH